MGLQSKSKLEFKESKECNGQLFLKWYAYMDKWTNKTTYFSSYITIDWNCVLWLIIDWLLCCLTSYSRIFHHYRDVIITWESCTIYALAWLWTTLEHTTGIFIVPYLLWHWTSVFNVSPKDRPVYSPLTINQGYWGSYLTRIP